MEPLFNRWKKRYSTVADTVGTASIIGLHLLSGMLIGGAIGYGLDYWFETKPVFMLIFFFIGIVAGFINVYRDTKRLLKAQEKKNDFPNNK